MRWCTTVSAAPSSSRSRPGGLTVEQREMALAESLAFCRLHLAARARGRGGRVSPRGRRPGGEDTRAAIIAAARSEFAQRGYDGTSLRAVAREAGVDPKLVHHYFDGKSALFAEVLAFPANPAVLVERIAAAPRVRAGRDPRAGLPLGVGHPRGPAALRRDVRRRGRPGGARPDGARVRRPRDPAPGRRARCGADDGRPAGRRTRSRCGSRSAPPSSSAWGCSATSSGCPALADASVEEIVAVLGPTLQAHLAPRPAPDASPGRGCAGPSPRV